LGNGAATLAHRTDLAAGVPRHAHHGAEVHQRLVEIEDMPHRHQRLRQPPQVLFHLMSLGIAAVDEDAEEHPRNIRIEDGGTFAEGKAADGTGRIRADPLERKQRRLVGGEAMV
jgi:hypothetical protein